MTEWRYAFGLNAEASVAFAQLHTESGYKENATSRVGAEGIAQFMPATAAGLQRNLSRLQSLCADAKGCPLEPRWSIRAMTALDRDGYEWAVFAPSENDRLAWMLSLYNGGGVALRKERIACAASAGTGHGAKSAPNNKTRGIREHGPTDLAHLGLHLGRYPAGLHESTRPVLPDYNRSDAARAHAVLAGQSHEIPIDRSIIGPDGVHPILGEASIPVAASTAQPWIQPRGMALWVYSHTMSLAERRAPLLSHVGQVVGGSAGENVKWIAAWRSVATVTAVIPLWERSDEQLIRQAVHVVLLSVSPAHVQYAVPVAVSGKQPDPTSRHGLTGDVRENKLAEIVCDNRRWFGHVERVCLRADWACKENRSYPNLVLNVHRPRYVAWLSGG